MVDMYGRLEVIEHATVLGLLVVAASSRGVVRIWLPGNSMRADLEFFSAQYRRAEIAYVAMATPWTEPTLHAIDELYAGRACELPSTDISGSDFERQVWDAICQIPRGQTRSYLDIAKAIEKPTAVRAVGQACGANPLPILVPCHRVLGNRGKLRGFGGGLDLKARLLAREGALLT
jgi:O-6-methylguanine DNA methyltransferase